MKLFLPAILIVGKSNGSFHSDDRQLLADCSIQRGDVDSSMMFGSTCKAYMQMRSGISGVGVGAYKSNASLLFVVPNGFNEDTDFGYCVDMNCINRELLNKKSQFDEPSHDWSSGSDSVVDTNPSITVISPETEHKFTGPKRQMIPTPIIQPPQNSINTIQNVRESTNAVLNKIKENTGNADWSKFAALFFEDNIRNEKRDKYYTKKSECSIDDKRNQNQCCGPNDKSSCCGYKMKVRDMFGFARFGLNRFGPKKPTSRIVGGTKAEFLAQHVAYITKPSYLHQFCGGVLIGIDWVLTAAHCLQEYCNQNTRPDILVKLGKTRKDNFLYDDEERTYEVDQVICHPKNCKSDGNPRVNDIALVRLSAQVHQTPRISIADMPLPYEEPTMSKECIMLGWGDTKQTGYSDKLKQVSIPLVSNEQCNDSRWRSCGIRSCMMCAGELNRAPCAGDSGGPLFCPSAKGGYQLMGVYSYGRCGNDETKPSVFTRVSHYIGWIDRTVDEFRYYQG